MFPHHVGISCTAICTTTLLLVCSTDVRADFFKYKDDSGSLVITDKLEDIPQKYRKRVKVVWDKDLEAKDPLARRHAAAQARREQQEQKQEQQVQQQKKQQSAPGLKTSEGGKTVVITFDESTGQLIRTLE